MSFLGKAEEKFKEALEVIWMDVPSVVNAPRFDPMNSASFDAAVEEGKEYKALDSRGLWIVQNPALIAYQSYLGISPIIRKKPKLALSADEMKKGDHRYRHQVFGRETEQRGVQI